MDSDKYNINIWLFSLQNYISFSCLFRSGTPGVGKSKLCEELIRNGLDMEWIEVGQVAKQCNCYSGYDEEFECHVLNEDKVCIDRVVLLIVLLICKYLILSEKL